MQLSELLQWLSLGMKTGTLLIEGHGVEKRIYFSNGRIAVDATPDQAFNQSDNPELKAFVDAVRID